jgi:hypothetical protein
MGERVCWLELLWELTKYEEYGNWSQRKVVQAAKNDKLLVGIVARMMNCEIILHD